MVVFGLLVLIAGIIVIYVVRTGAGKNGAKGGIMSMIGYGAAFLGVILMLSAMVYVVNPGEVGVEVLFGSVKRYTANGMHVKNPFSSVHVFDIKTQREELKADGASQDLQLVTVEAIINYRLDATRIPDLYSKVGRDYVFKVLTPAVNEAIKAATARYKVEEVIVKRHEVKELIVSTLQTKLSNYYIILEDVNIQDIDFSAEFNKVVEEKQIEEQKIKTADYRRQQAEQDKQRVILEAQAEGEKQRLLRINTSKEVVDLKWIEKWNGQLPTTMLGGGSIPMVNISK